MRLFKKISALIAAVAIFGSTALAGDLRFDEKLEYAAEATKVTVNVYSNVDNMTMFSTFGVDFNNEVYTFNQGESTSQCTAPEWAVEEEHIVTWATPANMTSINTSEPLATLIFDVNSGKSPVNTTFTISEDYSMLSNTAQDYFFDISGISITVTAATPAAPQPGDIKTEETVLSGNKKYLEIYDKNTQPRYVVIDTISSIQADDASVLKATYGDEEKTAKLFDLLTVDEGATGGITINNLTIKMVLPYGSEQPGADDFSFAVEAE